MGFFRGLRRPGGGIGRRSRLKIYRRKSCGFDPHPGYQLRAGAWSRAAAIVPVMDEVGVCAYCDLLAQLALRPELPAPAQKSSPKK